MEFFERAHVTRKDSSKRENKSETVKKQLKQMLHAYKKGNNQEIKSFADKEHKYDIDDIKSVSDFSDLSFHKEDDVTNQETASSRASDEVLSNTVQGYTSSSNNELSLTKSEGSQSETTEDSLNSLTDGEESKSSIQDISATEKSFSSSFYSSILSEGYSDDSSNISIPSSLKTSSGTESDLTDDGAFDQDGALASKILEKLGKNLGHSKKRKLAKEDKAVKCDGSKKTNQKLIREESKQSLHRKLVKQGKTKKKLPTSIECSKAYRVHETKDEIDLQYRNITYEMSEDSLHEDVNIDDSLSSDSSQFISVSALDMKSQSLSDIIGDYVHPTIKNLPSEKQNIVHSQSTKYAILDEMMNVDNSEDVSSLIPEIDEELAVEDLTLDTEAQETAEETTAYDETVQTEDYFEHESSTDIAPTSAAIKVYNGRSNYILIMKHPAELFIHGKVKVTAIGGSVEIFGYTLQDETINLCAPYCYFAHSIKTMQTPSAFHGLFSRLVSAGLTGAEAEEIITTVAEHDAVISLNKINCPKMDFVDDNFMVTELFSKRSDQTPKFLKKAAESLGCSLYVDEPKRILEEKSSWEQLVMCGMNDQSKGIICGGKGTGKSTLLRYYVNRLLTNGPVLVIDLDPGQAEFTIAGNISASVVGKPLIGPNFTHLRKPERTLNIGMINTMDNPTRYISAVKDLITYCQSNEVFHSMPWIVNTMGMCNNMGLKFITYIILQIQPTFVYQIDSKIPKKRFEFELQPHIIRNLYEEYTKDRLFSNVKDPYTLDYTFISGQNEESSSPQKGNNFALSPKDERYLNVLAYFGELLNIYGKNILGIVPYEVNIRDLNIGVNVKIPEEALTKVINGKIIALCQLTAADKGKMFTLADNALLCHGYGLIRGIDFEKGNLYILTPVSIEDLNLVNALVYADWMPELRGQEKELPGGTIIPFRTATVFNQRSLMYPPRRRFNPLQLLKVTRSS